MDKKGAREKSEIKIKEEKKLKKKKYECIGANKYPLPVYLCDFKMSCYRVRKKT